MSRDAEPGRDASPRGQERDYQRLRARDRRAGQLAAPAQQPHRRADRPALRHQPPDHDARRRDGEARRPGAHQPPASSSTSTAAPSSSPAGSTAWRARQARGWDQLIDALPRQGRGAARRDGRGRPVRRRRHLRVPPHRQPGPEGREGGPAGQEGDGRGEPPPRDLDRQEVHEPRPAVPRSHPGRQHRPDEGGRQVRVPPRLQVLDLRDLVDPAGDHPLDRRPGPHHPHPGPHDRDDQQARPHRPPDAARDRPRADARGAGREAADAAREGPQGDEDRQGADLARDARSATRRTASSATSSRTRTRSCRSTAPSRRT